MYQRVNLAGRCHWVEPGSSRWLQQKFKCSANFGTIEALVFRQEKLPLPRQIPSFEIQANPLHQFPLTPKIQRLKVDLFRYWSSVLATTTSKWTFLQPLQEKEEGKETTTNKPPQNPTNHHTQDCQIQLRWWRGFLPLQVSRNSS